MITSSGDYVSDDYVFIIVPCFKAIPHIMTGSEDYNLRLYRGFQGSEIK